MTVATNFGPRVIGFADSKGPNVFAELGDLAIGAPGGRKYTLRGGHRLWAAPEIPEITYEPDDTPVIATERRQGLEVRQTASNEVGLEKTLMVSFIPEQRRVKVMHTLTNRGDLPISLAPWAITQLPTGGTAIIPLQRQPVDRHSYQPNAAIAIWPYAGIADDPFVLNDRLIILDGTRTTPTKIGTSLNRGWLAYVREGIVFVKRADHVPGGAYVDYEASGQCYCNADFVELETLGELTSLAPGASTSHVETWELHQIDPTVRPENIANLLDLDEGTRS